MKNKAIGFSKRALAYAIDISIVILIIFLVSKLIPLSNNVTNLNKELNEITTSMLSGELNFATYLTRFSSVIQNLDKEKVFVNIINAIVIIVYFVIIPYFMNGKTVGLKIIKSKIVRFDKELLSLNDLLIRNIIVNGLGYLLICLASIYVLNEKLYFPFISILGVIQIFIIITSMFMIIYRKDNLGLQDILSKTKIIKEVE